MGWKIVGSSLGARYMVLVLQGCCKGSTLQNPFTIQMQSSLFADSHGQYQGFHAMHWFTNAAGKPKHIQIHFQVLLYAHELTGASQNRYSFSG